MKGSSYRYNTVTVKNYYKEILNKSVHFNKKYTKYTVQEKRIRHIKC